MTDSEGNSHTVLEYGDFMRIQSLEGTWSNWMRSGGRLKLNGEHVNPTEKEDVFEIASTGERLTATPSSE
ncbi:hypothetical protein ACFIQG_21260 [Comamonas odontotermitis]|uniref:hypothetical protein n=1 Tax=Comamonas odontotermitis TaxID=379895 RepID=UPI00366C30B0